MRLIRRGYSQADIRKYAIYSYDDRTRYLLAGNQRTREARIFAVTTNIPGRHLLESTINQLLRLCRFQVNNRIDDVMPGITIAAKRGTNLFDITRKVNDSFYLCQD